MRSTTTSRRDLAANLYRAVRSRMNADGGWPYYPGKASRLEPTAWALVAMHAVGDQAALEGGRRFLASRRYDGGLVVETPGFPGNAGFNGLVTIALSSLGDAAASRLAARIGDALVDTTGIRIAETSRINRQNNNLAGWSWIAQTFSWVEPTAVCLLGIKKMRSALHNPQLAWRIDQGNALLFDRASDAGGWNYGNGNMLGSELPAYVPTTAWALLALQDRRDHPAVARGLAYLRAHALSERSGLSLALALLCLEIYGVDAGDVAEALADQWHRTGFLGNMATTAMALSSVTADDGTNTFRL